MGFSASIESFFQSPSFGVVGASPDRAKFGNRVLLAYLRYGKVAYPVNPGHARIEGMPCLASVANLPDETRSISIITPPARTEEIVREAVRKGIKNLWMQPGAEHDGAVAYARSRGLNVIADGSCVLVVLAQRKG